MGSFHGDLMRGKPGEIIAQRWLQGIDFDNLKPFIRIGRIDRPYYTLQEWTYTDGKNGNRDWMVTDIRYPDRAPLRVEVKTDFLAHVNHAGYSKLKHTCNICIEVDTNCIANPEECMHDGNPWFKMQYPDQTAWFNVSEGGHADWYAHYVPLVDRDKNGEEIPETSMVEGELSSEEIQSFLDNPDIAAGNSIVTRVPFEYILLMRWDKLRDALSEICGIKFKEAKPGRKGKARFVMPILALTDETKPHAADDYDCRSAVVPLCKLVTKDGEDVRPNGKIYLPQSLAQKILETTEINGEDFPTGWKKDLRKALNMTSLITSKEDFEELLKKTTARITSQRKGIRAYECGRKEYEFFSNALAARNMIRYPL